MMKYNVLFEVTVFHDSILHTECAVVESVCVASLWDDLQPWDNWIVYTDAETYSQSYQHSQGIW
jgi:hypothetical protein